MIAPTAAGRKGRSINTFKAERIGPTPGKMRVTGSLVTSYYCPTSANRLPCPLGISDSALTRSFRFRIPQPPAPRGRRDRVYRRGFQSPRLGQRKLVLFFFGHLHAMRLEAPGPHQIIRTNHLAQAHSKKQSAVSARLHAE